MSALGRGAVRDRLDRYDTPAWTVDRLLDRLRLEVEMGELETWAEPAVGAGSIVTAANAWMARSLLDLPHWWLVDLRPRCARAGLTARRGNFLAPHVLPPHSIDFGVTNPPYRFAHRFARRMVVDLEMRCVALLLRLNWIEGATHGEPERAAFLRDTKPYVWVLPNRPRFTRNGRALVDRHGNPIKGSDATTYAWVVWIDGHGTGEWDLLPETPVEERRAL